MAGGGGEAAPREHKGKGKRRKGRRLGTRIDMTPLVDVAFLLLTFFMFTTSMSRPQTMEINLPPDEKVKVEIAETKLLTLRVNDKGNIFQSMGIQAPKPLDAKNLRAFLKEKVNTVNNLVVVLKIEKGAKFSTMVDMIDEFNLTGATRFSMAPFDATDKALVDKAM